MEKKTPDIVLVMAPPWDTSQPPINIAYLSAYARSRGLNPVVFGEFLFGESAGEQAPFVRGCISPSLFWAYVKNTNIQRRRAVRRRVSYIAAAGFIHCSVYIEVST